MNGVVIVCICTYFSISSALEQITNPGNGSLTHCGINEDCNIICNQDDACKHSTFYVYNHTVNILCSGHSSCQNTTIFSSNVQSLNLVANATKSFIFGRLHTHPTDVDVNVQCSDNEDACYMAWFHYRNQGVTTHTCRDKYACKAARIHALSPISVTCGSNNACQRLDIILPPDEALTSQCLITLSGISDMTATHAIKIKSLFPFANFNCINNCSLDFVYVIYGLQFDRYCVGSDTSCLDSMESEVENMDNLTIIDTYVDGYPQDIDYSAYHFNGDVLMFALFPQIDYIIANNLSLTFIPPSMSDNSLFSMVCLLCHISLNVSSIQNMVLTSALRKSLFLINVFGPQNYFKINSYDMLKDNTFHLEETKQIVLNSVAQFGTVYLGHRLDVTINCRVNPLYSCSNANIYSSLQPSELRLGPVNGYWNFDCPDSSNPLTIHFTQYLCMYHNYSSNCTFMTLTPTVHPTQETLEPSQSTHNPSYPTVNPSYPTQNPSVNPSKFPTRGPSMIPSINPSAYPTHYPTNNPIIYPTASPMITASLATSNPTRSPLDSRAPSSSPTRYPTATPSQPPVVAIVTSHPVSLTGYPSNTPSGLYTTRYPTGLPSQPPVVAKVTPNPSKKPSQSPVIVSHPTPNPSLHPNVSPTGHPSTMPSVHPTYTPQPTRQQDANVDHDERSTTLYLDYNIQDNDQSAGLNELVLTLFIVSISLCITVGVVGVCLFSRIRHNKALAKQIAVVMSKTFEEDANETVKIPKQSSDTPGTVGMANAPGTVGMHNTYDLLWSMPMNSVMTMSRSPGSDDGNVMNDLEPQSDGDVVTRGGHDDDQMHVTADVFDEGTEEGNENMNEGAVVMETKGGTRGGPGQTPPSRVLHEDFENVDQNVSNLHSICFVNAANMDEVIVDEEEDGMITTGGMDTAQ